MNKIKLFILDDHQMLIDGLKALLENEHKYELIGTARSAREALELIKKASPDIVLTDINMPEMNGIEFTRKLKSELPQIKIIALSMFGESAVISEMINAGVVGYILKNTGKEELLAALNKVAAGGMFFSDEVAVEMMKSATEASKKQEKFSIFLTGREKEIVQLIAKEYSNAKIAEQLFISERTVESHRKNIFRKTNVKTVVGLIKYAIENGLVK